MALYDTSAFTESSHYFIYPVWSQGEHRWINLTFTEYQSWLTRPDLDPGEFAAGEVAS